MKVVEQLKKQNGLVSEDNLAEILNDRSIDAIIALDSNNNIISWNNTAAIMYGKSKKQALGNPVCKIIAGLEDDTESLNAIQQALAGRQSFVPASKQFAHRKHTENHYIPLQDNDGNVTGVMNIVHDVAHRIKAEQKLQQLNDELEKRYRQLKLTSDELASFTVISSTKIKEPIRHVYTGVEHLISTEARRLSDSGKAAFRRIQSSLNRMDLLLDDILNLAQISILDKPDTTIDLNDIIAEVSDALKSKILEKNVDITTGDLCTITAHKKHVSLLLHHLVDNAIKFNSSQKPVVHIECSQVLKETATGVNEYYKLSVTDNGIGFNKEDGERMFQMFEKVHDKGYKGSGMGLAIARKIMEVHEGFITAENNETGGSTFTCHFLATDRRRAAE